MLVLDANVAITACTVLDGLDEFGQEDLVAPPLLWSETRSVLHALVWRGVMDEGLARRTLARLESGRIRQRTHRQLSARAWSLADSFGWAKTYDAEYVALAMLSGCRLVTTDDRLRRATEKLGFVVSPSEVRRG